jgi:hypothetical protein
MLVNQIYPLRKVALKFSAMGVPHMWVGLHPASLHVTALISITNEHGTEFYDMRKSCDIISSPAIGWLHHSREMTAFRIPQAFTALLRMNFGFKTRGSSKLLL